MGSFLITLGWLLQAAALLAMVLVLTDLAFGWLRTRHAAAAGWWNQLALVPVQAVRGLLPTVYRGVDFAPWLTLVLLLLLKTFVFRALIYWGMLHRG